MCDLSLETVKEWGINPYAQVSIEVHSLALTKGMIIPYYIPQRFDKGELR